MQQNPLTVQIVIRFDQSSGNTSCKLVQEPCMICGSSGDVMQCSKGLHYFHLACINSNISEMQVFECYMCKHEQEVSECTMLEYALKMRSSLKKRVCNDCEEVSDQLRNTYDLSLPQKLRDFAIFVSRCPVDGARHSDCINSIRGVVTPLLRGTYA